ncbi:hypothetical protein CAPTEDRAFT_164238 [Capitella teleta]|uniref:Phosphatidylinositol transfer protein N-terminal domain-containing protein n=1 Tax=Capitella teleta TaxID=283909 RepID=R7UT45_CAPTE|nr:hypothetical protein CAPTEDRAFT_164238 [Capitella teleta]|eukprot:ELU07067.1 hypothetical protein CAPTEDRAFT_164238 [Capitella teleta]
MTVEEYQVAQLYSVAQASKNETGGGEGIEVLKNEPFPSEDPSVMPKTPLLDGTYDKGQFTHKIYHLASKVPKFIRLIAPKGSLEIHEEAWNAYPYCRTVISNPDYMKENFVIKIETMHVQDDGTSHNVHCLDEETLKKREVITIDIANDPVSRQDYKPDEDPSKYKSEKTGRGPLVGANWPKQTQPMMCAYKLVTVEFKWWGLQTKVEKYIQKAERRIFTNFHRQVFCWTDLWYGLTMQDIRELEDKTKRELDEQIKTGTVRGTTGTDD